MFLVQLERTSKHGWLYTNHQRGRNNKGYFSVRLKPLEAVSQWAALYFAVWFMRRTETSHQINKSEVTEVHRCRGSGLTTGPVGRWSDGSWVAIPPLGPCAAVSSHAEPCIINPGTSPTCSPATADLICLQSEDHRRVKRTSVSLGLAMCGITESWVLKFTAKGSLYTCPLS